MGNANLFSKWYPIKWRCRRFIAISQNKKRLCKMINNGKQQCTNCPLATNKKYDRINKSSGDFVCHLCHEQY
jgi:hypothetical protein